MAHFLEEILGPEGTTTLNKAVANAPILKSVIIPRVLVSWLSTMGKLGYEGELPGTPNSYLSLFKSESGTYAGALTIQDQLYAFEDADMLHVAASVGVALGIEIGVVDERLKAKDLTKLGKSIDLLVKTEIVKKLKAQKKVELVPEKAIMPRTTPPKQSKYFAKSSGNDGLPHRVRKLTLTDEECRKPCKECGNLQFHNANFIGCWCFDGIAKSVSIEKYTADNKCILAFGDDLDDDAIEALTETFKD